jgi:hypothetical protein
MHGVEHQVHQVQGSERRAWASTRSRGVANTTTTSTSSEANIFRAITDMDERTACLGSCARCCNKRPPMLSKVKKVSSRKGARPRGYPPSVNVA